MGWGENSSGQLNAPSLPAGITYVAVASGAYHSLGLRDDGIIHAWGASNGDVLIVPALPSGLTYTAIAAGATHNLALRSDGSAVGWGNNVYGQCNVPPPPSGKAYVALALGDFHSLGLRNDGTVAAWGYNGDGQTNVPALSGTERYTAIAAGSASSFAIGLTPAGYTFSGQTTSGSFFGDGSGLTGVLANSLTGTVADAQLSSNVAMRNVSNAFAGPTNSFAGNVGIGVANPGRRLVVAQDHSTSIDAVQIVIQGQTNPNRQLELGYHTTNNVGTIQAIEQGAGFRPLLLNPQGGNVGIGTSVGTSRFTVSGDATITGSLSKGGGSFKIDHPLDPENQYLYHSFVESPDMMNMYNGNVITDAAGYATITLPDYFEALNRDFRYQLTVMDDSSFALVRVSRRIVGNTFEIASSTPNTEVSWMVTGVRHDAWAEKNRIPNAVDKSAAEKGKYLHPEAFGKPAAMGVFPQTLDSAAQPVAHSLDASGR